MSGINGELRLSSPIRIRSGDRLGVSLNGDGSGVRCRGLDTGGNQNRPRLGVGLGAECPGRELMLNTSIGVLLDLVYLNSFDLPGATVDLL